MSSVSDRQQKPRRQDFPFQPASQRGGKGKWSQNSNTLPRGGGSKAWSSNASQQSIPQSHSPSIPHATHSPIVKNDTFAKHMHDRMLYLLIHLVGLNVQVVVKGGTKYEGLFHAASTEGELGVVLKYARVIKSATEEKNENSGQIVPTLIVLAKDCLEVNAVGVDLSISEKGPEKDTFKIDTHISGHTGSVRERELHKWNPDDHVEFQTLEELDGGAENQWDQFAANEHLFGLQTDFDEEIYTTKLDRSSSDYKEREKKAIRIANEIARMSSVNPHIAEERGQFIDDSQLDEEDKYSSVVRANSLSNDSQGKYKPPAMRTKVKADESKTSNSTVTAQQSEQASSSIDEHKNKAKQSETVAKESGRNVKAINSQSSKISEPIASLLGAKPSKKLSSEGKPGKPIEAEIVGTFRTFVNHEKERLQQTRQ
ncbi:poly(A)-binding protein binding protein, partial [Basidiobolus ranarum]